MELLAVKNLAYEKSMYSKLRNINFSFNKGDNIVFFGTEDSGVDMLCSIIAGAINDYDGEILFKGREVNTSNIVEMNRIRCELVYLQSNYGLISNMSVEENIALPLKYHSQFTGDEIDQLVDDLVEELNLVYCRHLRPVNLRMSQILKTAYARAVTLDPDLVLVEHPLEGQSLLNVTDFMVSLKKRCDNPEKSVIIISYKPKYFLDFADRFIMLYNGHIVFDGNQEEFKNGDNHYVKQFLTNSKSGPMEII